MVCFSVELTHRFDLKEGRCTLTVSTRRGFTSRGRIEGPSDGFDDSTIDGFESLSLTGFSASGTSHDGVGVGVGVGKFCDLLILRVGRSAVELTSFCFDNRGDAVTELSERLE